MTDPAPTPLRVLYSFPHPLGDPGIGTTAINQVRGLSEAGHHVTVYTTSVSAPLPSGVEVVTTMTVAGQRVPHRAIGVERAYRYHDRRVARVIASRSSTFDVVHAWPRGCLATFHAARRHQLVSFRESPNPHTAVAFADATRAAASVGLEVPAGHSHRDDPERLAIEVAEYDAADFVLTPSDYVVASFLERGVGSERLVHHRYGFDPAAFPPPTEREPGRPFTALFLGSGEPRKGLHLALRAWLDAQLGPDAVFLIAGSIEQDYRDVLAPLLAGAAAVELGFQRDTGALLRRSDVLLLPSFSEGSALVTYEAMASGAVPLVSTAAGAPIIDGVDGLLHPVGDVELLAGQLAQLADQPDVLAALRDGALQRRNQLSWTAAGEVLAAGYRTGLQRGLRNRHD
jgi:glycosyltransferase involved in cell wall biosynthesis